MSDLEFHPLANLFPMLSDERLASLAESIKGSGLREPIVLHEGKILDGRNRYRACRLAGVDPRCVTYDGDAPAQFVRDKNLERRDLTDDQRAGIIMVMQEEIAEEVENNRRRKISEARSETVSNRSQSQTPSGSAVTRRTLAKQANVSERKIQQAAVVHRAAPELLKEVQNGTMKLKDAERIVKEKSGTTTGRQVSTRGIRPSALLPGQGVRQPTPRRTDLAARLFRFVRQYPNQHDAEAYAREVETGSLDLPMDDTRALYQRLQASAKGRAVLIDALKRHITNLEQCTS